MEGFRLFSLNGKTWREALHIRTAEVTDSSPPPLPLGGGGGKGSNHRRMINTEEKAKVVASVWGVRIYSILCCASYFAYDDFEESDEFIL